MNSLYDEIRLALHNVWKRRWLALLVAWGICLVGWLVVSMIPNRYQSQARVFVQMQSLLPEKVGVTQVERQRELDRLTRTLTSTTNMEKVVQRTALGKNLNTPKEVTAAAEGLKSSIKFVNEKENVFLITAEANFGGKSDKQNAALSRDIVQSLINVMIEDNLSGNRVETSESLKFLDTQIAEREKQLRDAETAKVTFESRYPGLIPGAGSAATRRESARMELSRVESDLISAQSSLASIRGQLAGVAPTITTPSTFLPGVGPSTQRAAQLEAQISEAYSRGWTDSHPDMSSLKSQLARAQAAAARESTGRTVPGISSPNPAYSSLQSMVADKQAAVSALSARRAALSAELAQYNASQVQEPAIAAELAKLSENYNAIKAQYDKLVGTREEIRVRGNVQSSTSSVQFNVTDKPTLPTKPAAPDRPLLLTGVLILGLLAGAGVAFLKSQVQTGFPTARKLASISGLPVIGAISEVMTPRQKAAGQRRQKMFLGGSAALAGAWVLLIAVDMLQRSGVI